MNKIVFKADMINQLFEDEEIIYPPSDLSETMIKNIVSKVWNQVIKEIPDHIMNPSEKAFALRNYKQQGFPGPEEAIGHYQYCLDMENRVKRFRSFRKQLINDYNFTPPTDQKNPELLEEKYLFPCNDQQTSYNNYPEQKSSTYLGDFCFRDNNERERRHGKKRKFSSKDFRNRSV